MDANDGVAGPGEAHPLQAKHSTPKETKQRDFLSTQPITNLAKGMVARQR
jgi:hypothetical protein